MISKLEVALPEDYQHIFVLLNSEEDEHKNNAKVQFATAKRIIKSHFETRVKGDAKGSEEGSMMCMFVGGDKSTNRTDTFECNHCGKNRHTAYCEGNHFAEHLLLD